MKIIRRERQFIWVDLDLPTHRSLSSISEIDKEAVRRLTELGAGDSMDQYENDIDRLAASGLQSCR